MSERWDVALEGNYRHAGRDEVDASRPHRSGYGRLDHFLTPRILFDAGRGWVLRASGQIPLSQAGLNGSQREKAVFNVGLTRLFRK